MLSTLTDESQEQENLEAIKPTNGLKQPSFFDEVKSEEEDEEEEEKVGGEEEWCLLGLARDRARRFSCLRFLISLVPILTWLPRYKWREDLAHDLVSGFTVAVMHIPQGMAYAMLAGVEPMVGIYTAFAPVLVYGLLGTMPHVSMGTFAVVSILVSKPVLRLGLDPQQVEEGAVEGEGVSRLQVATAVTLCVGVIQASLGLLRLGSLAVLLTDCLVSAFTVGASLHVFTSQLRHLLGLALPTISGPGRLLLTYLALGRHLTATNLVSLALSLASILLLLLADLVLAPRLKARCSFPLPTQLVVVILATLLSTPLQLAQVHGVRTIEDIGEITTGVPAPTLPTLSLLSEVLPDSFVIAVVAFTVGQGLGNLFGAKHGYKVLPNQELVAQGMSNLVGSCMSSLPMAGSLSRSLVQESSGCRSQVTGLTSATLLLGVLLLLGPYFQPLPICVLASIIVTSLTGMFKKLGDLAKYWERSPLEGLLWIVTFLTTVFGDVDLGLVTGLVTSLLVTLVRGGLPQVGHLQVSLESCSTVLEIKGPLNYITVGLTKVLVEGRLRREGRRRKGHRNASVQLEEGEGEVPRSEDELLEEEEGRRGREVLVVNLLPITHLDQEGAGLLPWMEAHLKESGRAHLGGVVAPSSLHHLFPPDTPLYTSLQRAQESVRRVGAGSSRQVV